MSRTDTDAANALARQPEELFAEPRVTLERRADGAWLFRSQLDLQGFARCSGEWLERWAAEQPDALLFAERAADGAWIQVTYGEALARVYRIATWLIGQDLSPERPVLVLSDNGIEHALLMLACLHIGAPICSVSPGHSLLSQDFAKLKANVELLRPGVIFADTLERFMPAINASAPLRAAGAVIVAGSRSQPQSGAATFAEIEKTAADRAAVKAAFNALTPDTIAKFLFTSGSISAPKAVIITQRMMCSNVEAKSMIWPFLNSQKPVLCDWLPWSHVFGGCHNFNLVMRFGGSLFIDEGKPLPARIAQTVSNLIDVAPTLYLSVPLAYGLLAAELRDNAVLRKQFFSRLQIIFCAGAALPQSIWEELERLAVMELGHPVVMLSSWGATETAPACTDCHFQTARFGMIGVPVPGVTLKLMPVADKLEVRVKGPNVFPGYWRRPDLTAKVFDEERYYMIGDAVSFVDPARPELGLRFDGRIAEDFKLLSGTWVHVGSLRVAGVSALFPIAQDIVVTGHNRDEIGFLIFPNLAECRRMAGLDDAAPADAVVSHPAVKQRLREGLMHLKQQGGGGSSTYPARALLLAEAPSKEAGEITDKGYVNQRAVLDRRADRVLELHFDAPDSSVILI